MEKPYECIYGPGEKHWFASLDELIAHIRETIEDGEEKDEAHYADIMSEGWGNPEHWVTTDA